MQNWIFPFRSRTFVLLVMAFLFVMSLVYFEVTKGFDQYVVSSMLSNDDNPPLDLFMQLITESADVFYTLVFGIALIIIKKTRRIGITIMILLVLTTLLTGYIKCGVGQEKPDADYDGVPFPVDLSRDTFALFCEGGWNNSYPSGHAARAMIFAIILGYALSERFPRGSYLLLIYPILVATSRVYVIEHYPMDVIGGILLASMLSGVLANQTKLYRIFEKLKS